VSDAAHHCVQRRVDLLFTMSNNLHRADRNQRDTNSGTWTSNERRGFKFAGVADRPWPHSKTFHSRLGGARRDRTDDLLLAKQALSQLSYGPGCRSAKVVGLGRLELPTSRLSSARSNQLSYKPNDRPHSSKTHSSKTDLYGTGSSMKKEKRRRRCPANGPNRS
jgi:hypothetical protein